MFITLFKTLLLPPAMQFLIFFFVWLCWRRFKRFAKLLLSFTLSSLLLLSLPIVSEVLFVWLERPFVKQAPLAYQSKATAVIVLGAGILRLAPEFGGQDQLSHHGLWRLRYGAYLAHKGVAINGKLLPVIVSGGVVKPYDLIAGAQIAAEILQQEFAVEHVLVEPESRNTWQNARNTAKLLKANAFSEVLLVTHAYHMRRARYAFKQAGIDVIPMATGFFSSRLQSTGEPWYGWWDDWLPRAISLQHSYIALHEYLGLLFYWLFK